MSTKWHLIVAVATSFQIGICPLPPLVAHSAELECNTTTILQMKGKDYAECAQKMKERSQRLQKMLEESDRQLSEAFWGAKIEAIKKKSNCMMEWAPKYAVISDEPTSVLVEVVASRCGLSPTDLQMRAHIARIIVETRAAARQEQSPPQRSKDRGA